ncbi:hypothetical protein F4819DRAFT_488996 [Hypoxylon fuscum]|nr:hypothetical protein F4819DRAFT_488996 [Hypoxylon fuscum]
MSTVRSDEVHQGSPRPTPRSPEYVVYANDRLIRYTQDNTEPVNIALAFAQSSESRRQSHRGLLRSVDGLFGVRHQAGGPATATSTTAGTSVATSQPANQRLSIKFTNEIKGVGALFNSAQAEDKCEGV